MRTRRLALFALACVWIAGALAASAEADGPGDAYKQLVAAVQGATGWEPILPLLSASFRKGVEGQDAAGKQAYFAYFEGSLDHRDLAVASEKVEGDTAVLEATGRSAEGKPSSGRIQMVREGGAWKLEDYGWATPD